MEVALTKEAEKEQGETIPPQCGSLRRSKIVDDVVLQHSEGGATHSRKQSIQQSQSLIYYVYVTGISS